MQSDSYNNDTEMTQLYVARIYSQQWISPSDMKDHEQLLPSVNIGRFDKSINYNTRYSVVC